jgi:Protein of unknown function (DUF2842)
MRKPLTALILLVYIFAYAILAATVGGKVTGWAQMPFYIVAGIVWIFPLKPLFAWMNRGTPPVEDE